MLPGASRVRTPAEHRLVARRGRRGASGPLSVRVLSARSDEVAAPARAGIIVPKSVGTAVARNLVKRRLRHLLAARIVDLPWGTSLVVRADAGAAALPSGRLADHLDAALTAATRPGPVTADR